MTATLVFDIGDALIRRDPGAPFLPCLGARAAGMAAHRFTDPDALERDLTERGLL